MARDFTIKVYSRNNGTVDIQTMNVSGEPGDPITKFFCVDEKVFKYEIIDEFGEIIGTQNLSTVSAGVPVSNTSAVLSTQWETLTACCNANWLLTEDSNNIIGDNNSNTIILS